MPSYKVTKRNSFEVNGRKFFVARVRYMDDGQMVFELKDYEAIDFGGFWKCLLTPDRPRGLTCREKARRMVKTFLDCGEWMPTKEQIDAFEREFDRESNHPWWWDDENYLKCFLHFNPIKIQTAAAA